MGKKIFNITVSTNSHGDRIDKFLQSQISKISRTRLQILIRDGHVKLNNTIVCEVAKKIKDKDKIEINFPPILESLLWY